jgi:hypothetical protein
MAKDDKKKDKLPTFKGDKAKYAIWKIQVELWESKKKAAYVSITDQTQMLLTAK